ncbi:MAG: hypothetical protein M3R10_05570 [Verrucomicrobiota bacterium]|nr:hypothetical protein [Verrucomicrobiota bacterium]
MRFPENGRTGFRIDSVCRERLGALAAIQIQGAAAVLALFDVKPLFQVTATAVKLSLIACWYGELRAKLA